MVKWRKVNGDWPPPKHEQVLVILPDGEECWAQYSGYDWIRAGTDEELPEPVFWKPLGE